jgi:hypothetical protein
MPKRDQSQEALQVEQIIGSKPVRGETRSGRESFAKPKNGLSPIRHVTSELP